MTALTVGLMILGIIVPIYLQLWFIKEDINRLELFIRDLSKNIEKQKEKQIN